jgi:hypothetical protein
VQISSIILKGISKAKLELRFIGHRRKYKKFYLSVIPRSSAAGIKGIRIQLRDWIYCLSPSSCGGASHAPSALLRGAPPPFDFATIEEFEIAIDNA